MKFEELGIEERILGSMGEMGFKTPTRIQTEAIPVIKKGRDVIGQSETGSGKTAAFGVPIIENVERGRGIQALVLAPTRELAKQIAGDFENLSKYKKLFIEAVYGGTSMNPQIRNLRNADIVVGTPGRIMDHMRRGTLITDRVKIFVLDEADKMISMGFINDIKTIERHIPRQRQTLLFSATMHESLLGIARSFTNDAKRIKTANKVSDDVLKQFYYDIHRQEKFSLLVHLIKNENPDRFIVFCNTRRDVDGVINNLKIQGIRGDFLHGGLTQNRREDAMERFHKGETKCLIATDVAARGLDIKDISHIFNYSIPKTIDDYANRIGRTARAGKTGKAITLLSKDDHMSFGRILRKFSYEIEKVPLPQFESLPFSRNRQDRYGRSGRFSRPSGRSGGRRYGSSSRGRSNYGSGRSGYRNSRNSRSRGRGSMGGRSRSGNSGSFRRRR